MKKRTLKSFSVVMVVIGIVVVTFLIGGFAKPAAAQVKTLKVGTITGLGTPFGRDAQRLFDAVVPLFNKEGRLVIGGERYKIELIQYDSKFSAETGRAAAERLIYQDKVKFIIGDLTADAWISETEANNVVAIVTTPSPAAVFKPDYKYVFQVSPLHTQAPVVLGGFVENYPEIKTVGAIFPDNIIGRDNANQVKYLCPAVGLKLLDVILYPADTTDFSAIATKIKALNPDVCVTSGGGTLQDALVMKFVREAGWRGQILYWRGLSPEAWSKVISLDVVEGAIGPVDATDLVPPPPIAKEMRDAYIAKYRSWDSPIRMYSINLYALLEAIKQAQSLDPDKVAAVIGNGMKFNSPQGPGMMISRPDKGNPRTIDTVFALYLATIDKGKIKIILTESPEKAFGFIKKYGIFGVYK